MSTINHAFFDGIGGGSAYTSTLPSQVIPAKQKNKNWVKAVLDRAEQIGVNQMYRNLEYNDYYKMINGDIILSDYNLPDLTKDITDLRGQLGLESQAKHYDFLGIIVNQVAGDYLMTREKFKVDSIDPISQNEYTRDKQEEVKKFAQDLYDKELKLKLAQRGINLDEQREFNSEEEQQQYLQTIEQEKASIISPEEIEKTMSKSWKTQAALWAEKTLEIDWEKHDMEELSRQEIIDFFLTGRWFRHYHIGYDYYKPENWSPLTTFFSEDLHTKYPQNGEYVGRINFLSPSDIVNRYGDKMTYDQQRRLLGYFDKEKTFLDSPSSNISVEGAMRRNFGEIVSTPFSDYFDYDLGLQLQDAFNTPLGEETIIDENGQEKTVPSWYSRLENQTGFQYDISSQLRDDIQVRKDLLQVVEFYWRSFKKIGLLRYRNKEGFLDQVEVTEDLLPEFLKQNEITTLRQVTLDTLDKFQEENTIVFTNIPEIRWGVKVKASNSFLNEDIYISGEPLEYSIKGDSNIYDLQLPVAGYIGNSYAKKMRPYIVKHNIVLNQVYNLLEKELGMFLLFDVHYLPAEYKNNVNTRESLEMLWDSIREVGIAPIDSSKSNMQGSNQGMNTFQTQALDFTNQINTRIQLAQNFKLMALEQIGINQQRIGTPSEYSTAEGIKNGLTASYAQTEGIYSIMSSSNKKASELHLSVAQYCQSDYKDTSYYYTKSDGEKLFIELSDDNFPLRRFGVVQINSAKERKNLEQLKQVLLQNNTQGSDLLDFAEIVGSDTVAGLIDIGRRNRIEAEQQVEAQRQHEKEITEAQIQADKDREVAKMAHETKLEEMRNQTKLESEQIQAYGRAADKGVTDMDIFDRIDKTTQTAISNDISQKTVEQKDRALDLKEKELKNRVDAQANDLKVKLENFKLKKLSEENKVFTSVLNKN